MLPLSLDFVRRSCGRIGCRRHVVLLLGGGECWVVRIASQIDGHRLDVARPLQGSKHGAELQRTNQTGSNRRRSGVAALSETWSTQAHIAIELSEPSLTDFLIGILESEILIVVVLLQHAQVVDRSVAGVVLIPAIEASILLVPIRLEYLSLLPTRSDVMASCCGFNEPSSLPPAMPPVPPQYKKNVGDVEAHHGDTFPQRKFPVD